MRRRTLLLGAPLGALGLAACTDRGDESSTGPAPAAAVENTEPVILGEEAPVVDHAELRLPLEMSPMIVVDPGWTSTPLELDGIFLGYREESEHLRFLAVEEDGTLLWHADRPLTCMGFSLTRDADGAAVAVLADAAPTEDALARMTLSAYDLHSAQLLWGPVEAPGPQAAVGLVYAEPTDAPMGQGGPRTALSGATGEPLLAEQDLGPDEQILGEHLGSVLRIAGQELVLSGLDASETWRAPVPAGIDPARVRLLGTIDPNTSFAALGDQGVAGAVIDLADGHVVAEDARAVARDHVLARTVVASGTTVRGLDDDGTEAWVHEDPEALQLVSAGERLAYALRPEEGTLVVLDTGRGLMVQPYDVDRTGPLAVPEVFSAQTAAAVRIEERRILVTTRFDEDYGLRS